MARWPDDDRYPGVEVVTHERMDGAGMNFQARFSASAIVVMAANEIERIVGIAGRGGLADAGERMARIASGVVMRAVGLIVLRQMRRDWTGFFDISMEIIDRTETLGGETKRGRVTRVDYSGRVVTVAWNFDLTGPKDRQHAFDDALDKLQRRDWDLP